MIVCVENAIQQLLMIVKVERCKKTERAESERDHRRQRASDSVQQRVVCQHCSVSAEADREIQLLHRTLGHWQRQHTQTDRETLSC